MQPTRTTQVINVNLREALANPGSAANIDLQPRDRLLVFGARQSRQEQVQNLIQTLRSQATFDRLPLVVNIEGNVLFPGEYPLLQGMTVDDLVKFAGGFRENTILDYALVERQIDLKGTIEVKPISFHEQTLVMPEPLALAPLDKIVIFDSNTARSDLLASTLERLGRQSSSIEPTRIVSVIGNVKFPGSYPLHPDMNVEDLVRIAGGLTESAEIRQAEITRYDAEPAIGREIAHVQIDLRSSSANGLYFNLQPFDQLVVRQMPNWTEVETVTVNGEVNSPGTYVITQNETLTSLIERAGGLSQYADARSAVFLRESLRETEARLIAEYRDQLETDIVTLRLQQTVVQASGAREGGESEAIQLLDRIKTLEPTGRLVINLPQILSNPERDNVILRDQDTLLIPRFQQEVTVTGEVARPTSHIYRQGLTYSDYIDRSGGLTDDADIEGIYVIKSSGELVQLGKGRWFFQSRQNVEPGDTLIAPFNAYKPFGFFVWTNIAQIVASFSTTLLLIDRITD